MGHVTKRRVVTEMMNFLRFKTVLGSPKVLCAALLVFAGLLLNYVLERHSFLPLGMLSPRLYLGGWLDVVVLPTSAFFLALAGIILVLVALVRRSIHGKLLRDLLLALLISIPLAALYGAFYFGMQFLQTGADVLGECSGLDQAASSSGDIPDSVSTPGGPVSWLCRREVRDVPFFLQRSNRLGSNKRHRTRSCIGKPRQVPAGGLNAPSPSRLL